MLMKSRPMFVKPRTLEDELAAPKRPAQGIHKAKPISYALLESLCLQGYSQRGIARKIGNVSQAHVHNELKRCRISTWHSARQHIARQPRKEP